MNFSFLASNRFWALVIGSLTVVANDGFTQEAWLKGLGVLVAGFVAVRTTDRLGEKLSQP